MIEFDKNLKCPKVIVEEDLDPVKFLKEFKEIDNNGNKIRVEMGDLNLFNKKEKDNDDFKIPIRKEGVVNIQKIDPMGKPDAYWDQ